MLIAFTFSMNNIRKSKTEGEKQRVYSKFEKRRGEK